ncbi:MAG: sigma-70 family RNA polymerase sigma factor [Planctomycetes bacterium]|nr:sigma-70 family RNA polymerase sigma factor [Planctomycetota bacterium]
MSELTESATNFAELIDRVCNGEPAALNILIQHNCQRLTTLTRHMLNGYPSLRRWAETDDVLQGSLMRLLRALEQVRPTSPQHFAALATLQIRRELIDLARHFFGPAGLAANHDSRNGDESTATSVVEGEDLSHEPSTLAQWCELHQAIAALPENERQIVDLLYYQGMTQIEAARLLEFSVRTVQRRWHSALLKLHQKLKGFWPGL